MSITDLRTSTHEQLLEHVTATRQVTPGDASLYQRNPDVPPARIGAYPKRRPTPEPSPAPSARPPAPARNDIKTPPADITYADFLRIDHSQPASIAV